MTDLILYSAGGVPSPRRVCMTLLEKRLPFRVRWLNLALMDQKSPDYLRLNPMGLVPTLLHGERALWESNVIAEYLDAIFPDPSLTPPDPWGQAQMRMWFAFEGDFAKPFRDAVYETFAKDRLKSTGVTPETLAEQIGARTSNPAYLRFAMQVLTTPRNEEVLKDRTDILLEKIGQMEDRLADERPWLCGDTLSLADLALAPRLDMFPVIGVTDIAERFPRVGRLLGAIKARPSWTASALQPQPGETERYIDPADLIGAAGS